ncbi:glycosyl hydrolase [Cohnella cholangitidis]|uniref:Beta-mannosidase n=1 Tax=Cohnella cholangitidis TaxID=2598458 RepID=A0A7G5BZR7_9BACL|nr:glycosyl hydrolase [Cohnella cholangitidis]QMV42451.1 beta-mannosidase [Cohnella cholangitidis]
MNKKLRIGLVLALVLTMVVSTFTSAAWASSDSSKPGNDVSDIQGHWAQAAIEKWNSYGVLKGTKDGSFQPNGEMTRAEFVTVVNRLFGFKKSSPTSFSDVPAKAWYAESLLIAKEAGYYTGFPNNEAKPLERITRQDAVTLLSRAFSLKASANASFAGGFKDAGQIAGYAKDAINALEGVISGYANGTFGPNGFIKRAEVVSLVDKLIGAFYWKSGEYSDGKVIGHAVINASDVTLRNSEISKNLYLASGIGDGDATLDHVTVKGTTFVNGGGENSITVKDSSLPVIVVNRPDGKVHLILSGQSAVGSIVTENASIVELGQGAAVENLTLSSTSELILHAGASVKKLIVTNENTIVNGKPVAKGEYSVVNGVVTALGGGASSGGGGVYGGGYGSGGGVTTPVINLVDSNATADTRSLFLYLNETRGKQLLFGHQHATDEGLTLTSAATGLQSEVKNSVGDFPAVFGWDTLSLEGKEKPGVAGNLEQSRANLIESVKAVHKIGGIVTLSAHMPNFVTGGSFNDTTGSVVEHILPGGDKNAEYNEYLDNIALFANNAKDDNGKLIPILFRPFHEQNGGWFWWGAKTTSTSQYVEIFRYTVEYLRDKKGVHNFLYAFSPNGTFGGSESSYMTTYPGDDYVDVLGMDQYDNQQTPGTAGFLSGLVADLKMISKLADRKGKIATFSEFGYSPAGMLTTGNADTEWFTRLLQAIKSDPDAKRIAYMQTWANFGLGNNLFVPYRNAPNGLGDHELLPDFIDYYNDPYTGFLNEVKGVYNKPATTANEQPLMHVVSPTDNGTVRDATTVIRARALNVNPVKVVYSVEGSSAEIPMTLDADRFFYTADWSPAARFNGKTADITVKVYKPDNTVLQQTVTVFVKVDEILMKSFPFDSNITGIQNNGTYPDTIGLTLSHGELGGNKALELSVSNAVYSDTWQELKLEFSNLSDTVTIADVKRVKLDAWIPLTAGSKSANASIRAIAMLPGDWDTKYGMTTTVTKLTDLPTETIGGIAYAKYSPVIDLNDPAKSSAATGLALSLVGSELNHNGSIFVDNIRLFSVYAEAPQDPALVDDFESYQGSDAALAAKIIHAGGDSTAVTLDGAHKSGGNYAMKLDYTLAGSGYAGVTKSLGGVDWSGFNHLRFWLAPDGSNQKLVIQLKVDGVSFEAYPSLAAATPGWVNLHFNEFAVAPWDTGNAGKKINKVSLKNVQEMSIYVNSVGGATLSSSLYFDDIKAINDGTGGVPNGGGGSGSNPAPAGTLYGFETDTSGWNVEVNEASATAPSITTDAAAEGTHSMASTFSLAGTGFEFTKVAALDLSAASAISVKVKLSSGQANARLYIKVGSAWEWHDSGTPAAVDSNGFTTLSIPLGGIANLDTIQSIGVKIEPVAGGTGTAVAFVDDVYVTAAQPAGMSFDFETSADNWAINNDSNGAYNTAHAAGLETTAAEAAKGTHSLKADFDLGGGQFQLRHANALDLGTATAVTAKVKIVPGAAGSLGSGVKLKLFVQSGDGWSWFDSGEIACAGTDFNTVTFDLSGVTDKDKVKALGIQVLTPADSTGTATVYLDDVTQQ